MGTSANRLALSVDAHPDHMDGFLTASQLLAGLVTDSISPPKILVVTLEGRSGTFGATDWQIEEHRLSTAEPTVMLPWEDQAFDAVCAIDVIDRMAPTQRGLFVAECLRLGRAGAILSHPGDHPHILQAEQFVQFLYRERFRTSHPAFSADAVQRPSALEMKNMLHEQSLPFTEVQDAPLHEWVNAQIRHDHGLQHPGQREEFATSSINYRHFYCISKSSDLKHRDVEWSARSDETSRGEAILFPGIARTLGKMLSEGDAQKAQQTVRAQRYETQASALDRLLRKTNWQRLARGGRFSISQGDLVPGPHLVPCADQPLTWRCRDEHPLFRSDLPLPARLDSNSSSHCSFGRANAQARDRGNLCRLRRRLCAFPTAGAS